MKLTVKIISVIIAVIILASMTLPMISAVKQDVQATKEVDIYKGTIKVDGEIDTAWNHAQTIDFTYDRQNASVSNLAQPFDYGDNGVPWAKVLWDDEYLYILAYVYDTAIHTESAIMNFNRDGVEIYIDELNEKTQEKSDSTSMHQLIIPANANDVQSDGSVTAYVCKTTNDGYIVEVEYKFSKLKPKENDIIGFDISVNCNNTGTNTRDHCLCWNDRTNENYHSPMYMGNGKLCGKVELDAGVDTYKRETTKVPETTKTPETTKVPETMKKPDTTKTPETTEVPETTKTPVTTEPVTEQEVTVDTEAKTPEATDTVSITLATETQEPETVAASAQAESGGINVGLIIGVAAAAILIAGAVVFFVLRKGKTE